MHNDGFVAKRLLLRVVVDTLWPAADGGRFVLLRGWIAREKTERKGKKGARKESALRGHSRVPAAVDGSRS